MRARYLARFRGAARATVTALFFAVCGAAVFIAGVFIHSLGTFPVAHMGAILPLTGLFAVLGAMFGTVVAFDRSAEAPAIPLRFVRRFESPGLRTVICTILGALAVLIVRSMVETPFPGAWLAVGAVAGAALGWYGWRWAKYIDF